MCSEVFWKSVYEEVCPDLFWWYITVTWSFVSLNFVPKWGIFFISRGALPWSGHSPARGLPRESSLWMGPEVQNNLSVFRLQLQIDWGRYSWVSFVLISGYGSWKQEIGEAALLSKTRLKKTKKKNMQVFKQWSWDNLIFPLFRYLEGFWFILQVLMWKAGFEAGTLQKEGFSCLFLVFFSSSILLHGLRHTGWTMQCWSLKLFHAKNMGFYLIDLRPLLKHVFPMRTRPQM